MNSKKTITIIPLKILILIIGKGLHHHNILMEVFMANWEIPGCLKVT